MWDVLKPADIEAAKRELVSRRVAILKRQAEEIESLNSDQVELEAFVRLLDAFAQKFGQPASAKATAAKPAPAKAAKQEASSADPEPAPTKPPAEEPVIVEPVPAEPIPAEPVIAEPALAESAETEPAKANTPAIPTAKKSPEPVPHGARLADKTFARSSHSDRRRLSGTNFEMFSRAVSKSAS